MRRGPTSKGRTSDGSSVAEKPTAGELPAARILAGSFWHQCSPDRGLLDVADPALTSGRYHRVGGPGVWYSSSSETGAWAELFRHHEPGGVSPFEVRRLIGRVRVRDLKVLDLTDERVREVLGVSDGDLTGDDLTRCQAIAEQARAAGYDGVLAPSAALDGQKTLAIFASAASKIIEESSRVRNAPARMRKFPGRVWVKSPSHSRAASIVRASLGSRSGFRMASDGHGRAQPRSLGSAAFARDGDGRSSARVVILRGCEEMQGKAFSGCHPDRSELAAAAILGRRRRTLWAVSRSPELAEGGAEGSTRSD